MVNTTLPIFTLQSEIKDAVRKHPVVIITTETGAGKSTQVPQYLLDEGYKVIVTQPRRVAAQTVAQRVAGEYGTSFGDVIGFRTAYEHQDSNATRCLFVTDGLALSRELASNKRQRTQVLMIDEVHEWNLNIEILVAWARQELKRNTDFKLVLTSATLEAERLSAFFDGAPIINAPGRTFPVKVCQPIGSRPEDAIVPLLRQGRNVLVFQPGKGEIQQTIEYLNRVPGLNAEILPLHGELPVEERDKCFDLYPRPKCIVSTNIAETSITVPGINAVVDSGMERHVRVEGGIEGLYLMPISHASSKQRKGRGGRTEPGEYYDYCPTTDRPEYPVAEILRVRLDQAVLRLAVMGIDMETLEFFHQPDLVEIYDAKKALKALGCMDAHGKVTAIGRRVSKMPISVKYGRMIVEAEKLGVVDDVITIAAILEQGGINARVCPDCQEYELKKCTCWRLLAPGETTSDALAQLDAYKACASMTDSQMRKSGIFVKAYRQARAMRKRLAAELRKYISTFQSSGKREDILRAVAAGMVDHLYYNDSGTYTEGDGSYRKLAQESVVTGITEWLVGEPFNLEVKLRGGGTTTLPLVRMATAVNPTWLTEIAPHLTTVREGVDPRYDAELDEVVSTTQIWFNDQMIEERVVHDPNHRDASQIRRDARNLQQWEAWTNRPEITLPDPSRDDATIPDITISTYGADVMTGEPLKAYGVVVEFKRLYSPPRLSTDPWFTVVWLRNEIEAVQRRDETVQYLGKIRSTAQAQARFQQEEARQQHLKQQAEPLRAIAQELVDAHYYVLPPSLRIDLYSYTNTARITTEMSLYRWMEQARNVIARVEELLREISLLRTRAIELRNKANGLLVDHGPSFSDESYSELAALDVEDESLPRRKGELEAWISEADATIAQAEKTLSFKSSHGVGEDALAALRGKFGSR